MKRTHELILLTLLITVLLTFSACSGRRSDSAQSSAAKLEVEATAEPEPTPTPVPVISFMGKDVALTELEAGYDFELFGKPVNTRTTDTLQYLKQDEIGDTGLETFRSVLPYMYGLKYLSFDRCGTTDEAMAKLRDDFPDKEIVWRVFFGPFSCMTDVETIWASCDLRNETCDALKYCTKVKNLDIGHNAMTRLDFLYDMPDMELLIISCSDFDDITPVSSLKKLKIFEAYECHLYDLSPLEDLTSLEYVNIGLNNQLTDFSPLYGLYNLKVLRANSIYNYDFDYNAEEQKIAEMYPNCDVDFSWCGDGINSTWRYTRGLFTGNYTDLYRYIRKTFDYDNPYGSTRLYE